MAQFYQIVGQNSAVSLEELRQFYPNLQCLESTGAIQYVINPEESGAQFEPQQVLLSSEQQIVLNSNETQQIIIDQSQIQYSQTNQQYSVQENEMVTDYQPTQIVNNQQQIYYTSPKQHVIQQQSPQTPILTQQISQSPISNQPIISNSPRVVAHVSQSPIRQMVPQQQINNAHLMGQRRIPVAQNQVTQSPVTPSRAVQSTVGVRLQNSIQQEPQQQPTNQDDNQMVVNEGGRVMTLGQFKQEIASQNQQENSPQNVIEKPQYKPPPKRNYKRTNNGRGGMAGGSPAGRGRPRGVQQANMTNKPFQQVQVQHQQVQHQQVSPQPQQQQLPKQVMQYPRAPPKPPGMQQPPRGPIIQHNHPALSPQQHPQQQLQHRAPPPQPHRAPPPQQFQQNNRPQPLIPLSPHHVQNGHIQHQPLQQQQHQQQSPVFSPSNSQGQPPYLDDSNSSMSDEYRDSARMLVCLENGEQRLITFTLPKDSCTVQDLLEQVGVPFNSDTKIECISNPGSEIDYIVNVGAVNGSQFPIDAQQVLTVDNLGDIQECIVSQSGAVIPVTETLPPPAPAPAPPPEAPAEPELPPEPPKLLPKFVPGYLAVCNHCGYLSEDFNRCQRCKTRLPEDVKSISAKSEQKAKEEKKAKAAATPKVVPTPPPPPPPQAKPTVVVTPIIPNSKPPAKNTRGKKKAAQEMEPVVLTLSSDEEDNVSKPSGALSVNRIIDAVALSALQKEPVIPADSDTINDQEFVEGIFGGGKDEDLKANLPLTSTTLPCRTIRIGSYKFVAKEEISLSSLGIRISVPIIGDPLQTYKLFIPMKYIIKVLGNFSKTMPVLFFYVTPSIGAMIRKQIHMKEGSEYYFDPLSKEDPFKRITLLPEIITEETKGKIKEIYLTTPYKMLEELTAKEANDILIRTCPKEGGMQKPPPPPPVSFTEMRQLLIYPPGKGGIAINAEDYLCLAQDQFLNDVIIDFYLKYLATDVLTTPVQQKVYMFSSFFYKRLTTKPAKASKRSNPYEVDPNLTPAEKRHCRVKSWTKKVNIFEKDFVIIPINENSHWFLAIICYPGLEGCRSMFDSNKIVKVPTKEKKKASTITIGSTTISALKDDKNKLTDKPIKCDEEEGSDRDEAEGDESELEESETESEQEQLPEKKSNQREPIKQPCILIFDSLAGASRSRVVATLRDYLTCEHRTKLNSTKTFTKDNIKGACPKVPQQMNFTDCGLYVLQYVESFFKDPITDFHIPIKMLKEWFEEIVVTRKREEISNLIKELMIENNKDPSILPDIQFPTIHGELISGMESQFEEGEEEMEEEEEELSQNQDKLENSLTQISAMYNSDSSESPVKSEANSTSAFVVSSVNSGALKPDLSETKSSNRDTMSYLKSKRIIRHRNPETSENNKKQKIDK